MTYLVAIAILFLLGVIVVQIGKVTELAAKIRGEEEAARQETNRTAVWLVIFMIVFLIACVWSGIYYKNSMLGYGPLQAASEHGSEVDYMFNITLFFTGIVFVLTHIALFWYAFKYRQQEGRVAKFFPHNNTLELVWTLVPLIVMTFLVVQGLVIWNKVMPDVDPDDEYVEIEATGYQFAWDVRYPGPDNMLGTKDYKLIDLATNSLGIDFTDDKSIDDIVLSGADNIVLPVDTTVRVRITSKDVLHNFYLPHFRVKMDAVPGLPTYFIFRPNKTTQEFRDELKNYPEWREPVDPADPESPEKWEEFNFELACAELCGKGHYSMKRIVEIVSKEDYETWLAGKNSFYKTSVRNTDADPRRGQLLTYEIEDRKTELKDLFATALSDEATDEDKLIRLKYVFFDTGSASLDALSRYELEEISNILKQNPSVSVELSGHTDNTGDDLNNLELSENRAVSVKQFLLDSGIEENRLTSIGYGETRPIENNDTAEGREANRRTELRIISK